MRIFQVLSKRMSWGVSHDSGWLRNLYEPLIDLGHTVYLFEYSSFGKKRYFGGWKDSDRKLFEAEIIKQFEQEQKKQPFDLFFCYLTDMNITPDLPRYIKSFGTPTANFSCNNTHQFHIVEKISPHFDYNLHSEKDVAKKFKDIGANPVWFPMAANLKYYRPYQLEKEFDVTFVGQNYGLRPYYIRHLLENGINLRAWGAGWREKEDLAWLRKIVHWGMKLRDITILGLSSDSEKMYNISCRLADYELRNYLRKKYIDKFGSPLTDEEMIKMYSQSKISLGFVEVWDFGQPGGLEKSHIHLREFEAPMSGALYCTGYTEELTEFYEPDREVLVYRNKFELLDKIKYYLSNPVEAEKIRKAGHKRAVSCHTYQQRFKDLFKQLRME